MSWRQCYGATVALGGRAKASCGREKTPAPCWGTGAIERTGGPRSRGVIGSVRILGQREAGPLDRAVKAARL